LRNASDEIRQQQNDSEPFGTSANSKRKGARPTRAIVHSAAHDAADGLVDGALRAATEPANQARLEELKDRTTTSVRELTQNAGGGAIEGVNESLPQLQGTIVRIAKGIKADLNLDIERTIRNGVRAGIDEAKRGLADEAFAEQTRTIIAEGVVGGLRQGLDEHFLDDMQHIKAKVASDLAPAAEELTRAAVRGATQQLAYDLAVDPPVSRQAQERLGPTLIELMKETDAVFGNRAQNLADRGFWIALLVTGIAVLALAILWTIERLRRRSAQVEQQKFEQMLRLVAQAIQSAGDPGSERLPDTADGLARFRQEVKRLGNHGNQESRHAFAELNAFLTREQLKLPNGRAA